MFAWNFILIFLNQYHGYKRDFLIKCLISFITKYLQARHKYNYKNQKQLIYKMNIIFLTQQHG